MAGNDWDDDLFGEGDEPEAPAAKKLKSTGGNEKQMVCFICKKTPDDSKWASFRKAKRTLVPVGDACEACMTVKIKVYPLRTWEDVALAYNTDQEFAQEFSIAKRILAGLEKPAFDLADIFIGLKCGMQMFHRFAVLSDSEFLDRFKMAPDGIDGITIVPDLLQVDGTSARGIVMKHPDFPFRTLELFSVNESIMQTIALASNQLARPNQAEDHYQHLRTSINSGRHNALRDFSSLKTLDEVTELVADHKSKLDAQAAADRAKLALWESRRNAAGEDGDSVKQSEGDEDGDDMQDDEDEGQIVGITATSGGIPIPAAAHHGQSQAGAKGKAKARKAGAPGQAKAKGKGKAKAGGKKPPKRKSKGNASALGDDEDDDDDLVDLGLPVTSGKGSEVGGGGEDGEDDTTGRSASGRKYSKVPKDPVEACKYWRNTLCIDTILRGDALGREIHQADLLARKLKETHQAKALALQSHVRLCNIAKLVTPKRIPTINPAELKVHLMTLCKAKVVLPKNSQLALIRCQVAAVDVESDPDAIFTILSLEGFKVPTEDTTEDTFDPLEPHLAKVTNLTCQDLKDFFVDDIIGKKAIGLLQLGDKGTSQALALCDAALGYFTAHKDLVELLPRQVSWDKVKQVLRCIVALASPVPLHLGSDKADVQAVMEEGGDITMEALFGDGAGSTETEMMAAVKSALHDFWGNKVAKFWKYAVADGTLGPELAKLTTDVASGSLDILKVAVARLPEFRAKLRHGATLDLESLVVKGVQGICTMVANGNASPDVMKEGIEIVSNAIKAMPDHKELLEKAASSIQAKITDVDHMMRIKEVQTAIEIFVNLPRLDSPKSCKDFETYLDTALAVNHLVRDSKGLNWPETVVNLAGKAFLSIDNLMYLWATGGFDLTAAQERDCIISFKATADCLAPLCDEAARKALGRKQAFMMSGMALARAYQDFQIKGMGAAALLVEDEGENTLQKFRECMSEYNIYEDLHQQFSHFKPAADAVKAILAETSAAELSKLKGLTMKAAASLEHIAGGDEGNAGALWKQSLNEFTKFEQAVETAKKTLFKMSFQRLITGITSLETAIRQYKDAAPPSSCEDDGDLKSAKVTLELAYVTRTEGKVLKLLMKDIGDDKEKQKVKKAIVKEISALAMLGVDSSKMLPCLNDEIGKL